MTTHRKFKILITGAGGQLGSELLSQLDNIAELDVAGLTKRRLDITNQQNVFLTAEKYQPDFVVNCASYTRVDGAEVEAELCRQVNEIGARHLARACQRHNAVLIQLSTDYVFDGGCNQPYSETDTTYPLNVYGQSKLAGEKRVRACCQKHIIIRTSSLFSLTGKNFCRTILNAVKQGKALNVVSDRFSAPTYAPDLAAAIQTILRSLTAQKATFADWGIYHYCGRPAVSWYDFAVEVLKSQGYKPEQVVCNPLASDDSDSIAKRPKYSVLDCARIETVFGIKPGDWQSAVNHNKFCL